MPALLGQGPCVDQPPVDGGEGERAEPQHLAVVVAARQCGGVLHQHKVLDPDAEGPFAVIARLIGQDHAGFQHHIASAGQPLRSFMDGKVAADTMAGPMVEILPGQPEIVACDRIKMLACDAFGPAQARYRDHALQARG